MGFWGPQMGFWSPHTPIRVLPVGILPPRYQTSSLTVLAPPPTVDHPQSPNWFLLVCRSRDRSFFVAQFCSFSGGFGSNPTLNPPGFGRSAAIPGRPRPQCLLEPQILREKPQTRGRNRRKTAAFAPKRRRGGQGEPTAAEFWGKKEPKMGFSGLRRISFLPSIFFVVLAPA